MCAQSKWYVGLNHDKGKYVSLILESSYEIVAHGIVVSMRGMTKTRSGKISKDCTCVSIDEVVDPNALLPYPIPNWKLSKFINMNGSYNWFVLSTAFYWIRVFVGDRLLCDAALVKPQCMISIEYEIEASTATIVDF